jgi:ribosome biogenesis GTPase
VVNKIDLLNSEERAVIESRLATYRHIDCPMLLASTRTAHGLDNLREYLKGRTNILVGQSGVGKSSLIKALLPEREIRIQSVSEATGHGTHTTTTATLYHLPDGGDLIDSPGVSSFEPVELDPADLNLGFPEFAPYWGCCKFSNCSHTVEPDCALMKAVKQGEIDPRRLESYRQMKKSLLARQTDY